jgi:hypothetical protein
MKTIVTATAPTSYQYGSLAFFGQPVNLGNGSFIFEKKFDTKKDAIDYLLSRVEIYAAQNGNEKEIKAMRSQAKRGHLRYDAVSAYVERHPLQ